LWKTWVPRTRKQSQRFQKIFDIAFESFESLAGELEIRFFGQPFELDGRWPRLGRR
jgi:hypothetical protein